MSLGIDDEARAAAPPRRFAGALAPQIERIVEQVGAHLLPIRNRTTQPAAAGGGVDIDDRRIDARGDVRKLTAPLSTDAFAGNAFGSSTGALACGTSLFAGATSAVRPDPVMMIPTRTPMMPVRHAVTHTNTRFMAMASL
jgi:hypothetical protein